MNKKELEKKKKSRLFIVGSARGVNRFFITNRFVEKFKAKTINTGTYIINLTRKLNLKSFDELSIKHYFQRIEPILIQSLQDHLEHGDVILDTHFHYMMPALSLDSLLQLKDYVGEVILILVEEETSVVFENNKDSPNWWFKNIQNIESDLRLNKYYLDFYEKVFANFAMTKKIKINITNENLDKIDDFIKKIK